MPIVLNGSTGITTEGINVDTIVDTAGTGGPSLPNNIVEMDFVDVLGDITNLETNKLDKDQNIVLGTSVAASGTAVDFVGIPEGVKRITVMFDGVSTNGTSAVCVRLGTFSGIATSTYISNRGTINNTGVFVISSAAGFDIASPASAAVAQKGDVVLSNLTGNKWEAKGAIADNGTQVSTTTGTIELPSTLDRIRITTLNGTDQFDAGTINISWEF